MRLICYVHIGAINIDVTQSILDELFDRLHKSGLYKKLEEIRCGLVGQSARCILVPEKANVVFYNDDPSVYEIPTLNNMRDFESDKLSDKHTLAGYLGQKNARNYHLTLILVAMVFMLLYVMLSSHNISIWVIMIGFIPLLIHLTIFYSVVNPKDYDPQLKVLALSTFLLALIFGASHIFI